MPYKSRDGDSKPTYTRRRISILFNVPSVRIKKKLVDIFFFSSTKHSSPFNHWSVITSISLRKKRRRRIRWRFVGGTCFPRFTERGLSQRERFISIWGIHPFAPGRRWISSKRHGSPLAQGTSICKENNGLSRFNSQTGTRERKNVRVQDERAQLPWTCVPWGTLPFSESGRSIVVATGKTARLDYMSSPVSR